MTSSLLINNKQEKRLSRRLTVNTAEPYVNIRPIIKKSDKEAAYALTEAYSDNVLLRWVTGSIKDEKKRLEIYNDIFKCLIRTAAGESRDFAVQLNGCVGVMLWSEGSAEILSIGNVMGKKKLWGTLGGLATMRATIIHHRNLSKMKKRLMNGRPHLSLNFLGVLPAERRRKAGTSLIKHLLKKADDAQLPVFAEIWGEHHLEWFGKLGFKVEAEKNLSDKDHIMIYYTVREPQRDPKSPNIVSPAEALEALHLEPPREDALTTLNED